jgi:hypothetical protein
MPIRLQKTSRMSTSWKSSIHKGGLRIALTENSILIN